MDMLRSDPLFEYELSLFFTKLLIKKTKTQNNQLKHLFTTVTLNSNMRQQTSI